MRCKTICHMFTSIDGKIEDSLNNEDCKYASSIYESRNYSTADAVIIGRITADDGKKVNLEGFNKSNYEDYIIKDDFLYNVIIDPYGKLSHDDKYTYIDGYPKRRIIKVLSKKVKSEYLSYLKSKEIPFMICGNTSIDLNEVLVKLKRDYAVNTSIIGGPTLNSYFFENDLVDSISLVIAPKIVGGDTLSFVGGKKFLMPKYFKFKEIENLGNNTIILHYENIKKE